MAASRAHYGRQYQKQRAALLADEPPCVWCGELADTADHYPPLSAFPEGEWEGELLPSCRKCNYGKKAEKAHAGQIAGPNITDDTPDAVADSINSSEWARLLALWHRKLGEVEDSERLNNADLSALVRVGAALDLHVLREVAINQSKGSGKKRKRIDPRLVDLMSRKA